MSNPYVEMIEQNVSGLDEAPVVGDAVEEANLNTNPNDETTFVESATEATGESGEPMTWNAYFESNLAAVPERSWLGQKIDQSGLGHDPTDDIGVGEAALQNINRSDTVWDNAAQAVPDIPGITNPIDEATPEWLDWMVANPFLTAGSVIALYLFISAGGLEQTANAAGGGS